MKRKIPDTRPVVLDDITVLDLRIAIMEDQWAISIANAILRECIEQRLKTLRLLRQIKLDEDDRNRKRSGTMAADSKRAKVAAGLDVSQRRRASR